MKKAILTISIGEDYRKIGQLTHPSIKKYAEKINADFVVLKERQISKTTPHWEKFNIYTLLDKYDSILYIDTDIIIRDDCPDLFDIVPKNKLAMFNEAKFTHRSRELLIDTCKEYGVKLPNWNGEYYNTGVMLIPKKYKFLFKKPEKENCNFYEQTYLNMVIAQHNVDVFNLDYKFNRMTCMDRFTGEERYASYIIHYAGYPSLFSVLNLIDNDIKYLKKLNGKYEFKKHIYINVSGGIGDQICAEPAVRFAVNNVYKNDDVHIVTHWPEIFSHINGCKVWKHGEFVSQIDTPYYMMESHPPVTGLTWAVVSNLMCHTVDFCSISMLKRTLPLLDKTIKLEYGKEDLEYVKSLVNKDLSKLILVHPGRHWRTKTFPKSWWDNLVKELVNNKFEVCIIGDNSEETRGTVDIDIIDGILDLRDMISLKQLFALIANSKTLISNDSMPIHVAGAFDTNIILIPSCKHPDHILPYRNGTPYFKAKAFYKKLTLDEVSSQPNSVNQVIGDFDIDDWDVYLPEIKDIIKGI